MGTMKPEKLVVEGDCPKNQSKKESSTLKELRCSLRWPMRQWTGPDVRHSSLAIAPCPFPIMYLPQTQLQRDQKNI